MAAMTTAAMRKGAAMAVTKVSDFVIERFHPVLSNVMAHGHTHYWLHGGRGPTKNSFISICLVMLVIAFPATNAVVVRRFGNTLRDLVYQQVLWAIEVLGLDAVRSILNSLRRGGDRFWTFYSYNPPKTMWSWANVELLERKRREDTLVRGSSYLDVIDSHPEWLGAPFIEEAEYLRDVNETAWRWEYLGEIVGTGGAVFGNVHDARLSDSRRRGRRGCGGSPTSGLRGCARS